VFADDDERLQTDVTFSVTQSLIGRFEACTDSAGQDAFRLHYDLVLQEGTMEFPHPPIP
jgi:hypothetical protein